MASAWRPLGCDQDRGDRVHAASGARATLAVGGMLRRELLLHASRSGANRPRRAVRGSAGSPPGGVRRGAADRSRTVAAAVDAAPHVPRLGRQAGRGTRRAGAARRRRVPDTRHATQYGVAARRPRRRAAAGPHLLSGFPGPSGGPRSAYGRRAVGDRQRPLFCTWEGTDDELFERGGELYPAPWSPPEPMLAQLSLADLSMAMSDVVWSGRGFLALARFCAPEVRGLGR